MLPYASLISRLASQHEAIEKIISGADEQRLLLNPQPGKWSIKDNIAHLAKYQPIFFERMQLVIKGTDPVFGRYVADEDPEFSVWKSWDIPTLLDRLHADRKLIYDLIIGTACTQTTMTGTHKKFGKLSLVQWTEFFLLHEAHHLFTIFQIANNVDL